MKDFEYTLGIANNESLEEIGESFGHYRTAHAGNFSKTSQVVVAVAGAKITAFSGNRGNDPTYNPTFILTEGERMLVANKEQSSDTLTAFLKINPLVLECVSERFNAPSLKDVKSVAQLHIAGGKALWGEERVYPYHQIFETVEGKAVLAKLAKIRGSCDRILNPEGQLETRGFDNVEPEDLIKTMQSIGRSSSPGYPIAIHSGPVISNAADVVAHTFIRALSLLNGSQTEIIIFHSSGPDMINYTQKERFQREVQRISSKLAKGLGLCGVSLKELVYPASELKIAAPDTDKAREVFNVFSAMVDMMLALQFDQEEKNQRIKAVSIKYGLGIENEEKLTTEAKKTINILASCLSAELPNVSGLNFKPRQYTQWEMLGNGRKPPIIPAAFLKLNTRQIVYFTKLAKQIADGNLVFSKKLPDGIRSK